MRRLSTAFPASVEKEIPTFSAKVETKILTQSRVPAAGVYAFVSCLPS
jgi:hypothetical protein